MRYLNDRRESVRAANPNLPFAEITKILASEWGNLPADKKQQYLIAAEQDRERYTREYNAYKQTEAYKLFTQQQNEKKMKENREEQKTNVSCIKEIKVKETRYYIINLLFINFFYLNLNMCCARIILIFAHIVQDKHRGKNYKIKLHNED